MARIEPDELIPSPRMVEGAADGEVTQVHRGHRYAEEGDTFEIAGDSFEIVEVRERTLGDLTDEDARREGMADLEAYRGLLQRAHENFEWDDDSEVVLHRFERQ
jgi:hypothetical protein